MDGRSSLRSVPLRVSRAEIQSFRTAEGCPPSRVVSSPKRDRKRSALVMASVKKTMKSKTKQANKTKHAKQPATPKAKASKQSAVLKAKRAAAAWALAS